MGYQRKRVSVKQVDLNSEVVDMAVMFEQHQCASVLETTELIRRKYGPVPITIFIFEPNWGTPGAYHSNVWGSISKLREGERG